MVRRAAAWSRLAPIVGILAVSGCLGRMESGIDLVLGVGARDNLLLAPISGNLGAFALFVGRLMNL